MVQKKELGIAFTSEIFNYKIYVEPIFSVLQWNREQEAYLLILQSKLNNKMIFLENFTDYYFSIDFEEIKSHNFSFSKLNNTIINDNIKEYFTVYETVDGINYYTIIFKLGESVLGLKLETGKTIENVLQDENMKHFEELFKTINVYEKDENDIFNALKVEDGIKWNYVLYLENEESVDNITKLFKINLPEELIKLIKNYNGGYPNKTNCDINGFGTTDFKCLLSYNENDDENIYDVIEYFINKYNGEILPFACDSGDGYFCFSDKGIIYVNNDKEYFVSENINKLLLSLYEEDNN